MERRLVRKVVTLIYSDGSSETKTEEIDSSTKKEHRWVEDETAKCISEKEIAEKSLIFDETSEIYNEMPLNETLKVRVGKMYKYTTIKCRSSSEQRGRVDGVKRLFYNQTICKGDKFKCHYYNGTLTLDRISKEE